jgi:hypothetical protein
MEGKLNSGGMSATRFVTRDSLDFPAASTQGVVP